jgi:hypothetical protein
MLVPNLRTEPERTFHAVYSLIDEHQERRFTEKRKILTTYCGKTVALISHESGNGFPLTQEGPFPVTGNSLGIDIGRTIPFFGCPIAKEDVAE